MTALIIAILLAIAAGALYLEAVAEMAFLSDLLRGASL